MDSDVGIWAWLAAFYFDQLIQSNGRVGEDARWVPAVGDFRKYYRHLLAAPYQIFRAHRDNPHRALVLLANPPNRPGDLVEQLLSRQEVVTNKTAMQVATTLYIDPVTKFPKANATRRRRGGATRFVAVLSQLDLIWDLYHITPDQLIELLPAEFEEFKP